MEKKIPKWLTYKEGVTIALRKAVPVDQVDGNGDARDTARFKPPHRHRVFKKVSKQLKQAEDLWNWGETKAGIDFEKIKQCVDVGNP